jgi:hypothetical protein
MRIALFLLVVTASLFIATWLMTRKHGVDGARSRIERKADYDAVSLSTWVLARPREAKVYAFPILFPLDLLCMVFLAALLAYSSVALAGQIGALREYAWWFMVLPAVYLAADLAENTCLVRFLVSPAAIGPSMVRCAHVLTKLKIWSVTIAVLQTVALLVVVFMIERSAGRG